MALCTFHKGIEHKHRVVVYWQIDKINKNPTNFPNLVWFSESVLTALCIFHKGIIRIENMNVRLWFISQMKKKYPNNSPNVVRFSEPSLMAMYTFQRGILQVKNMKMKVLI